MTEASLQAWLDQQDARTVQIIRQYGWMVQYVNGGECGVSGCDQHHDPDVPAFAYTVGMFGLGHPEFLVFDLDPGVSAHLLNLLGERVREGEDFIPGTTVEVDLGKPVNLVFEEVPNPGEIVFSANRFYQRPPQVSVPVIQITYPDDQGRYPWDEGYDHTFRQPRPGEFRA
ncbi:MAG TPA: DUF4262 domain-containing protein [Acidimicrobiia bacterium]